MQAGTKEFGREVKKMRIFKNLKKKRIMRKAIEEAICPIWYITYCIEGQECSIEDTIQVLANNEGSAMTKATKLLDQKAMGKVWTITSISCI